MPVSFASRTFSVAMVVLLLVGGARNLQSAPDSDESYVKRWADLRQLISLEREGWRERRELLTYNIQLLKVEIGSLDEQIAEAEERAKVAEQEQSGHRAEESSHRAAAVIVEAKIGEYENKIRALEKRFPEPLIERIERFTVQIPESLEETDLSLAQRTSNVLRILEEIDKFNSNVTVVRELQEVGSGQVVEVKTMYLGLAQGYFVDPRAKYAAIGRSQPDGWKWDPKNALAKEISRSIAMFEKTETPAEFIELPLSID